MSEYVSTHDVKNIAINSDNFGPVFITPDQFDAWLADVKATALEEAADDYERASGTSNGTIPWLRARAKTIREGKTA